MKFICPSCGSRYRLGDDKLAGRKSPRMKCRKCGYMIDVRASEHRSASDGDASEEVASLPPSLSAPRPGRPPSLSPPRPGRPPSLSPPRPGPPPKPLPEPPPVPGGGAEGDLDTVRITSAVAESSGTFGGGLHDEAPNAPGPRGPGPLDPVEGAWMAGAEAPAPPVAEAPPPFPIAAPTPVEAPAPPPIAAPTPPERPTPPVAEAPPPSPIAAPMRAEAPAPPAIGPVVDVPGGFGSPPSSAPYSRGFMELQQAAGLGRARTMSTVAWVAVAVAYGLGIGTGALVFGTQGPEPTMAPAALSAEPAASATEAPASAEPVDEPDAAGLAVLAGPAGEATAAVAPNVAPKASPPSAAKPSTEGKGLLTGLQTQTTTAPIADPAADPGAPAGGGQLSSSQIQRTVSANTAGVRRACWQRALDGRDMGAPSSARVSVTIQVAPSGAVSSVSSSGDPRGYPGLSSCIERRVRMWTFPKSGASTTVNVPFVFAAQ